MNKRIKQQQKIVQWNHQIFALMIVVLTNSFFFHFELDDALSNTSFWFKFTFFFLYSFVLMRFNSELKLFNWCAWSQVCKHCGETEYIERKKYHRRACARILINLLCGRKKRTFTLQTQNQMFSICQLFFVFKVEKKRKLNASMIFIVQILLTLFASNIETWFRSNEEEWMNGLNYSHFLTNPSKWNSANTFETQSISS